MFEKKEQSQQHNTRGGEPSFQAGKRGATLVETMIAFSIFSVSAITLFPLIAQIKTVSRGTDIRELCMEVVQGKLAQYKAGGAVPGFLTAQYPNLSIPLGSTSTASFSGFDYAKVRYNWLYRNGICDGRSSAQLITASGLPVATRNTLRSLGIRECVGSTATLSTCVPNQCQRLNNPTLYSGRCGCSVAGESDPVQATGFANTTCSSDQDRKVRALLPGFKLYVKLERVTPWVLDAGAVATLQVRNDFRFHPSCPNFRSGPFASEAPPTGTALDVYDFDGVSDGIRVTVTGMIDFTDTGGTSASRQNFGGFSRNDPQRLMCSVSTVLTQNEPPVRFVMTTSDITALRSTGLTGVAASTPRPVLPTIVSAGAAKPKAFAVHPLNLAAYFLGANSLERYGICGGMPLKCKRNNEDPVARIIEDDGRISTIAAGTAVQSYDFGTMGNVYQSVLMDFGEGARPGIYVAGNSSSGLGRLEEVQVNTDGTLTLVPTNATTAPRLWAAFGSLLTGADDLPAVQGAIFDPAGGEGYVFNLQQQYKGLYRVTDTLRYHPIMRFQGQQSAVAR